MRTSYSVYDIEYSVFLINFKQDQAIDIKRIVAEFNVYEDIFNNVLACEIVLLDSLGLIERLPIVGDEKISLTFKTPGQGVKNIPLIFDVYKVSQRKVIEERSHLYIIHGVSGEQIVSKLGHVGQSYSNLTISSIVDKIYQQNLFPIGQKEIEIESTDGLHSYVFGTNPFNAINLLASEANSSKYKNSTSFLFYEDTSKFNFKSLSSLFDQSSKEDYYLSDINVDGVQENKSEVENIQVILGIDFEKSFDTMRGLDQGMIDNSLLTIDPILKKTSTTTFNYTADFDTVQHIGTKKIISDQGRFVDGKGKSHKRFISSQITNGDYKTESYLSGRITTSTDPFLASPRRRQKFLNKALSQLGAFSQYTFNITVPGNSLLKCGDMVNIFVPQNSDVDEDKQKYLKLFDQENPKFLITAIRHNYKNTTGYYTTTLSCVKESFEKDIKSEYKSEDRE